MKVKVEDIRAQWESLTPEQREAVINWVNETFGQLAEALQEAMDWMVRLFERMEIEVRRT